jgi:hypothetical protein
MRLVRFFLTFVAFILVSAACNPTSLKTGAQVGPQAWIDAPLDGSSYALPLAGPLEIVSHASDPARIAQVELNVNGAVVRRDPNPNAAMELVTMRQQWVPTGPGNYSLMVRAQNTGGTWGEYARAVITIGASAVAATRTLTPPPITRPNTITPLPSVSISFFADATTLMAGQCTTIHWQVTNVSQVLMDNAAVAASGSKLDCPTQTTMHTLRVITLDRQIVDRTLAIAVVVQTITPTRTPTRPPAGCTGAPIIASFGASPSSIVLGQSSTLSWGAVTNADSVELLPDIGGVAAPGSMSVSPGSTTTYTLRARCGGNQNNRTATVEVITRGIITFPTITSTPTKTLIPPPK